MQPFAMCGWGVGVLCRITSGERGSVGAATKVHVVSGICEDDVNIY